MQGAMATKSGKLQPLYRKQGAGWGLSPLLQGSSVFDAWWGLWAAGSCWQWVNAGLRPRNYCQGWLGHWLGQQLSPAHTLGGQGFILGKGSCKWRLLKRKLCCPHCIFTSDLKRRWEKKVSQSWPVIACLLIVTCSQPCNTWRFQFSTVELGGFFKKKILV